MAKLTAARIRTLKTPGRHGDGDGLHLKISEAGARSWILRVMIAGKRRDIGLGRYPDVGLAQAREAAAKHRSLIAAVQRSQASLAAKRCLEFLILTAARSGEARGARWSEIDLDAATWVTPAERMKANAEHRVPLSSRALATLEEARTIGDGSGWT